MNERNVKRRTLYLAGAVVALLLLWVSFGGKPEREGDFSRLTPRHGEMTEDSMERNVDIAREAGSRPQGAAVQEDGDKEDCGGCALTEGSDVMAILMPEEEMRRRNRYEAHFDSMPPGGVKLRINPLGGTLGRVFNDSNYLHIASASRVGIEPLSGIRAAWEAGARLERLRSCREYYLDELTHSLPYLVPGAHRLLRDIGAAFRDSLQARGGGDYRIKVTSVLRTPRLVRQLRRRNRNAVDTSAHLYGTTFDISYAKFICDSTRVPRTQEDMKNLLGEVVYTMREQGRCYVKYERKQGCFHITCK